MNKYEFDKKMHNWQKRSNKMHMARLNTSQWLNEHVCYSVSAGVGTGKTNDMLNKIYTSIEFVENTSGDLTLCMIVAPSIMLCNQIKDDVNEFFRETDLADKIEIKLWHCESNDFSTKDKSNYQFNGKHEIIIVCEKSLFGIDEQRNLKRYVKFSRAFTKEQTNGRKFLVAAFDEAHNYSNHQSEIFAKEYRKNNIVKNKPFINGKEHLKSLIEIFNIIIVASGTPHEYMKEFSKPYNEYSKYFSECTFYEAIKDNLIVKPTLYIIQGSSEKHWPIAIQAAEELVIQYIKNKNLKTSPRGVMNFNGINAIHSVNNELKKIEGNAFNKHNTIIIHGNKDVTAENGEKYEYRAEVNGKKYDDTKHVKKIVLAIDSNEYIINITEKKKLFKNKNYALRVFQVDMISEGINVKSLNYCIIETINASKGMQQIGRVIRKYYGKEFAFVFAFVDNITDVAKLLNNLAEYSLTSDCFNWGKYCDLNKGTSAKNDNDHADDQKFKWEQINTVQIEKIETLLNKKYRTNISERMFNLFNYKYNSIINILNDNIYKLSNEDFKILTKIVSGESKNKPKNKPKDKPKNKPKDKPKDKSNKKQKNNDDILFDIFNSIYTGMKNNKIKKELWNESAENKKDIINGLLHINIGDMLIKNTPPEIFDLITNDL